MIHKAWVCVLSLENPSVRVEPHTMVHNLVGLPSFRRRVVLLHLLHLIKAQILIVCLYGKSILIRLVPARKSLETRTRYGLRVLRGWLAHLHGWCFAHWDDVIWVLNTQIAWNTWMVLVLFRINNRVSSTNIQCYWCGCHRSIRGLGLFQLIIIWWDNFLLFRTDLLDLILFNFRVNLGCFNIWCLWLFFWTNFAKTKWSFCLLGSFKFNTFQINWDLRLLLQQLLFRQCGCSSYRKVRYLLSFQGHLVSLLFDCLYLMNIVLRFFAWVDI